MNFNDDTLKKMIADIRSYDIADEYDMINLWRENEDIRSLKSLILFGVRGMAAYAYHAMVLGYTDDTVNEFFYKALSYISFDLDESKLHPVVNEVS